MSHGTQKRHYTVISYDCTEAVNSKNKTFMDPLTPLKFINLENETPAECRQIDCPRWG